MKPGILGRQSLKSRIALLTLTSTLAAIWSAAFYLGTVLRDEMVSHLGEQQSATVSIIAAQIDDALKARLMALESVAKDIGAAGLGQSASLQAQLNQQHILQQLFNGGTRITAADGRVLASVPFSPERLGANYADRDYMQGVLGEGKTTIGRPVLGKVLKKPVLGIAAPIKNAAGNVVGAVVGVIDLGEANFLDRIASGRYGATGGYLLIAPQHQLIVTATDKTRVMHALPSLGANPLLDRYMAGYEGYGVAVSSRGIEELSAAKGIAAAGWFIVSVLPTAEAFAPIRDLQSRLLWATLVFSLLAGAIAWWLTAAILRRQLAPMLVTTHMLEQMSAAHQVPRHLPIPSHDEIGELIGGFNHLLDVLASREADISASEKKLATILDGVDAYIYLKDREGRYLFANRPVRELFGVDAAEIVGFGDEKFFEGDTAAQLRRNDERVLSEGETLRTEETNLNLNDGRRYTYLSVKLPLRDDHGAIYALCGISTNITERKQIEQTLRESEELYRTAFHTSPDSVNITRLADGCYLQVNEGFLQMTGWTRESVVGRSALELNIWADLNDRQRLIDALKNDGAVTNMEARFLSRDGKIITGLMSAHKLMLGGELCILSVTRDITARKQIEEQVTQLAFYDPLTMLPNRRLMLDRLNQAITSSARRDRYGALMLLDLDNFKTLNDTLGHETGDQLLIEVAARLNGSIRLGDTAARLGGDEFVLILEDLDTSEFAASQAEAVAVKIQNALSKPYQLMQTSQGGEPVTYSHHCTSSMGITLFKDATATADELLRRADTAMYQAKQGGRNALRFYDPQMQAEIVERATLEADLRRAIIAGEFIVLYQPQVDAAGRVIGAEALVRWQHPTHGLISPAKFIPLAESTGLILPIGHWVLETACRQLFTWSSQPHMAHLTVAVNMSARQFSLPTLVNEVLALINYLEAPASRLKLELTESLLFENTDEVIAKMTALKAHGVGFSLDDFGTGYSSLSYLKRLPLDQLKIDQSFVRDVLSDSNDATIARSIIALARSLGLHVIAEGVELEEQRAFLEQHQCHAYQGYLFGRPMPVAEFEALLQSRQGL